MVDPLPLRSPEGELCVLPLRRANPREGELEIGPGISLWRGYFSASAQEQLVHDVFALAKEAPFIRPVMPGSGKPFSVEQTNFGPLGWVSDKAGYRYQPLHPQTGKPWPPIPPSLLALWDAVTGAHSPARAQHVGGGVDRSWPSGQRRSEGEKSPQCCLANLYRGAAKMGLHQDRDESSDAPVLSVSLGDSARFRIGAATRGGPTKSLMLASGDVLMFGGPARMAYHGIDRILAGSSRLIPGGGRLNLTLRRVTP